MIEIMKDQLRIDETVLKHATSEEIRLISQIAESIARRAKEGSVSA